MNEITLFSNPEFGEIRTVDMNGETWFVGRDICKVFGDKNESRSLSRVDEEDKKVVPITDSKGRTQNAIFVNESGLYALLFAMRPQKANNGGVSDAYPIEVQKRIEQLRAFKHWVTHDVLPALRKHGSYSVQMQTDATTMEIQDRNSRAQLAGVYLTLLNHIDTKSETYKPILMAYAANTAAGQNILPLPKSDHVKTYSATDIATMLGVTANKIGRIANQNGMKSDEYGQWFHDIASSGKEIDSFRYNDKAVCKFKEILST